MDLAFRNPSGKMRRRKTERRFDDDGGLLGVYQIGMSEIDTRDALA